MIAVYFNRHDCIRLLMPYYDLETVLTDRHYDRGKTVFDIELDWESTEDDRKLTKSLIFDYYKPDLHRYLAFCELFNIGTTQCNNNDSDMKGYDIEEEKEGDHHRRRRQLPKLFDSDSSDSIFDIHLAPLIFSYAVEYDLKNIPYIA